MVEFVKVAKVADIPADTGKFVEVGGKEIALFRVGDKVYATTNVCPHQGGPLAEGTMDGTAIVCPWHSWVFDVTTGVSPVMPQVRIETYPVKVEGDDVYVQV